VVPGSSSEEGTGDSLLCREGIGGKQEGVGEFQQVGLSAPRLVGANKHDGEQETKKVGLRVTSALVVGSNQLLSITNDLQIVPS